LLQQRLTSTRTGILVIGFVAAAIAGLLVLTYISQYTSSVDKESQKVPVLVAKSLIVKGTTGEVIGTRGLFEIANVPRSDAKDGALVEPSAIRGRVAVQDIYPGQALTAADFTAKPSTNLSYKLSGTMRAVAVPLDSAHGLVGTIQTGDHVDVIAGFNIVPVDKNGAPISQNGQTRAVTRTIMQDVLVLEAPAAPKAGIGATANLTSNVVLRLSDEQAAKVAFASDNGKLFLSLRPQSAGTNAQSKPSIQTVETVLLDVEPIKALASLGVKP
jgi:Flp pilus assembly protein CpaB